jgi:hypothetical protein
MSSSRAKGLTELFTSTGKLKVFFFLLLEMFEVCTTGDTVHIDTIFQFLPHTHTHTHPNMGASIFFTAAIIRDFRSARSHGNGTFRTLHEMHVAQ